MPISPFAASLARRRAPSSAAVAAVQQRHAQFPFQRLDLRRQRRLRHVQPFGRAREVAGLGHGDEVAQLAQFHDTEILWQGCR
jgi:hypothetical protein